MNEFLISLSIGMFQVVLLAGIIVLFVLIMMILEERREVKGE